MQAWIPVVSWSLYFWKSVFSFWADSISKSDGYFISKLKVSRLRAFLWCMRQTSRDRDFLEMVRWESVPGSFFALTWKLSSRLFSRPPLLPTRLTAPGSPRMCTCLSIHNIIRKDFTKGKRIYSNKFYRKQLVSVHNLVTEVFSLEIICPSCSKGE